jgi:Na+/proline symporter
MLPLFISLCTKHLYSEQLTGDSQLALPNMVLAHTALPVQILFFGSLLSAIMSTTSSAILAPAAILSENIMKPWIGSRFTDKQFLILTKVSVLIFSAIGTIMACLRSNIYELVGESSILSLVSLFTPLVFGLYWKKANSTGALVSMIAGILSWFYFQYFPIALPSLVPALFISCAGMIFGSLLIKK